MSHQKNMVKYLRGVFNFAVEERRLSKNPVPIMHFRHGAKLKQVLTAPQATILLEKAKMAQHE